MDLHVPGHTSSLGEPSTNASLFMDKNHNKNQLLYFQQFKLQKEIFF